MWILAFFLLHFATYLTFRVLFLAWNWPALEFLTNSQLLKAFIVGLRFDLAAIAVTFGLGWLGLIWVQKFKIIRQMWIFIFWLASITIILLNCVDAELVNFTGRRFSKASLFLVGEGGISNLILPYKGIATFTFLFLALFSTFYFYILKGIASPNSLQKSWSKNLQKKIPLTFAIIIGIVIGFRGGLQNKPMTFVDARIFSETLANQMVLNSTYTLLKSLSKFKNQREQFFSEQEMLSHLKNSSSISTIIKDFKNINMVIIILESFSYEYLQLKNPEFTPFLNQLRKNANAVDMAFAYANGRRSIEGIAAILAGIPALMEEPFVNSEFSTNQFIGIGNVLKQKGYHTSFFHGAQNDSMHFNSFTKSLGIENYFGKSEYPSLADDDGTWGIYDGPFLNWACDKITNFPQPFFTSVFTLSSHQPYNIPKADLEKYQEGSLPILKAIQYTDSALEKFMACAAEKNWFSNTLFIFTADHTGPEIQKNSSFENRFRVPLIFYMDHKKLRSLAPKQYAQHIDILPTILETLDIRPKVENILARSLWQPGTKQIALYADGVFDLVSDGDYTPEQKALRLKAIRQYYSLGMIDNKLFYPVTNE